MKKLLSRLSVAVFVALVLVMISTFVLPSLAVQAADNPPECWAVVAGVSDYLYINQLNYSDDDAQDLYDVLSPVWGASHVMLLKDSQASKAGILAGISWMAAHADANDTVFFSFSGHGGTGFFCPYDSIVDSNDSYINAGELADALAAVNAEKIVVVMDTCFSGSFDDYVSVPGRVIMMASRWDEYSWEYEDLQNGAFSYFVIQALLPEEFSLIDTNDDYIVSAEEVADYADQQTWQYAFEQSPQVSDDYSGQLALMEKFMFATNIPLPAGYFIVGIDDTEYTQAPAPVIWAGGSEHTLSAIDAIELAVGTRYGFVNWSDGSTSATIVVTHGAYTANYEKQDLLNIISAFGQPEGAGWHTEGSQVQFFVKPYLATPDTKHYFTGWSGDYSGTSEQGTILMNTPATITANWRTEFLLAINSLYGQPAGVGWYAEGDKAAFSVQPYIETPDTKHYFTGWSGSYSGAGETGTIAMDAPQVINANWRNEYLLQVNSEYGSPTGAGWYAEGAAAPFSVTSYVAEPDAKHYFTGWKGDYTGTSETASLVMDTPKAVGATWRNEYLLTVNSGYGSPTGGGWYNEGATASFSVTPYIETPDTKHYFTGWSGSYSGAGELGNIVMDTPNVINAGWRNEYLLQVKSEYGSPTGAGWYHEGENAPVSVEPVQGAIIRQVFDGWSGDLTSVESSSTVAMSAPRVITAKWRTDYVQLYLVVGGVVVVAGGILTAVLAARRKSRVL